MSLQLSAVPQESRTLTSTVPEGAELQAECLLVREVKCVCVYVTNESWGEIGSEGSFFFFTYCGLSV